jgi:putative transposase
MARRYKNKYRVESARLRNWDYRNSGGYFVTICTHNREHYFGEIQNERMMLNDVGHKACEHWKEIPAHAAEASLGEFVVMPNHIHGIIILRKDPYCDAVKRDMQKEDGTLKNAFMTEISPWAGSLSAIVRSFKSSVTKWANELNIPFGWQARFHDHIIRNDEEFIAISNYIINNPRNWKEDKFFTS